MNIAWIGTGVMGSAMAINLSKSGHNVSVFSRTISKCEPLKEFGIRVKNSIKECVRKCRCNIYYCRLSKGC